MMTEFFWTNAQSLMTAVSFATFIGIVAWSYSGRRQAAFAEAANLPFADEANESGSEVEHG